MPKVSVDDLSLIALRRFREKAMESHRVDAEVLNDSTEHLLQDLHLLDEDASYLKRAATILFHPSPERFVTGAYARMMI